MNEPAKLRLFDLTMIVIGLVIGMGIFRTSKDAALGAGTPLIYFASWVAGGIVAFCGALTYAEIGARFPATGAYYRIFSYAYHPSLAFALNVSIIISNASSVSAIALVGAGYFLPLFIPAPQQWMQQSLAVFAIILFYFINLKGLRLGSTAQNVLMLFKITMLLFIIAGAFYPPAWNTHNASLSLPDDGRWGEMITSFGVALVAVSFTYGGYQQTINFGSEVQNPQRNIPRGIGAGIAIIIFLYLLTNISYFLVVGFDEMKSRTEIASLVISKLFGPQFAALFSLLLFISVLSYVNANLLSNPRVMYAMSNDGVLPGVFAKGDESRGVYGVSLAVFAATAVLVVFFAETFERILSFSIFLDCFGMATSASTLFILRKKTPQLNGKVFSMRLYPLPTLIFIAAYVFIGIVISYNTPLIALTALIVMLVSVVLYFLVRRKP